VDRGCSKNGKVRNQRAQHSVAIVRRRFGPAWGHRRQWRRGRRSYNCPDELQSRHMQSRDESGEHHGSASYENGRGKCFTKINRHLRETRSVWGGAAENIVARFTNSPGWSQRYYCTFINITSLEEQFCASLSNPSRYSDLRTTRSILSTCRGDRVRGRDSDVSCSTTTSGRRRGRAARRGHGQGAQENRLGGGTRILDKHRSVAETGMAAGLPPFPSSAQPV
jgi:hypothetical protein